MFVAENNSRATTCCDAVVFLQPGFNVTSLEVVSKCLGNSDLGILADIFDRCLVVFLCKLARECLEELFLAFQKLVETDGVVVFELEILVVDVFCNLTIEHAFVGNSVLGQSCLEIVEDVEEIVPESDELLLELRFVIARERLEEMLKERELLFLRYLIVSYS